MNIQERLNTATLTLSDAEAIKAQLTQTLAQLQSRRDELGSKALALVTEDPDTDAKVLNGIVAEQNTAELRITGAQTLLDVALTKIADLTQQQADAALAERWALVRTLLDQRNVAIDAAEESGMAFARSIKKALSLTAEAIKHAPKKPGVHDEGEIVDGMNLIPAMVQRFWLEIGFRHPAIGTIDNLYARQIGTASEVFSFECQKIYRP